MKTIIIIFFLIFSLNSFACDVTIKEGMGRAELQKKLECLKKVAESGASIPIGTIISSYLTPAQIKANYGDSWLLADGRKVNVETAFFRVTGSEKLPDLRGVFLRGINEGRKDTNQDPDGERYVGSFQKQLVGTHNHSLPYKKHGLANGKGSSNLQLGAPSIYTDNSSGVETRPNNVAVYFYIKVN